MDRQLVAKATHSITLRQKVGTAQNLYLGDALIRGLAPGIPFVQTATIQRPAVLQTMNIDSTDGLGDITDITVSGLSLFVSDQSACLAAFTSNSFGAKQRSIGCSISNNQTVVVQGSLVAGGAVGMSVGLDPIKAKDVKSPAAQATSYDFVFGCGTTAVPPIAAGVPGTATLIATSTRPCTLGQLILQNHSAIPNDDLVVDSIRVAGLQMLAGATATQQIPLAALLNTSSDIACLRLSYPIESNARVEIQIRNFNAAAAQVAGAILIEPWK